MKCLLAIALLVLGFQPALAQTPSLRINFVVTADADAEMSMNSVDGDALTLNALTSVQSSFTSSGVNGASLMKVGYDVSSRNAPAWTTVTSVQEDTGRQVDWIRLDPTVADKHDYHDADVTVVVIPCQVPPAPPTMPGWTCESEAYKICPSDPAEAVIVITWRQLQLGWRVLAHELGHMTCATHADPTHTSGTGTEAGFYRIGSRTHPECFNDVMVQAPNQTGYPADQIPARNSCTGWTTSAGGVTIPFTCNQDDFCQDYAELQGPGGHPTWTNWTGEPLGDGTVGNPYSCSFYGVPPGGSKTFSINVTAPATSTGNQPAIACTPVNTGLYSRSGAFFPYNGVYYNQGSVYQDAVPAMNTWLAGAVSFRKSVSLASWVDWRKKRLGAISGATTVLPH